MRLIVIFISLLSALPVTAAVEFNRDIRPVLSDRCFSCHGPDKNKRTSGLRLDIEEDAKKDLGGGRRGIVPGDPSKSEIIARVTSAHPVKRMPPKYLGKDALSQNEIDLLAQWIREGAKYQPHWSFIPPKKEEPPVVKSVAWPRNQIDRFVLARLEKEGLTPSKEASQTTLLRRVTLDLTGLPPTPEEVAAFQTDSSLQAYEKVVDRLLASRRHAERMAIRWLDAARYADTNGYQSDGPRDMWRWRDWVIEAFQNNMPFNRFTVEQLAGDLLPNATMEQRLATGFHRNHRTTAEGGIVDEEFRTEYVADRAETTSTVWLGLTVGCARCHDHKYDPIKQKDFYSLFAFFNNVPEKGFVWNFGNEPPVMFAPLPQQKQQLEESDRGIAQARSRLESLEPSLKKAQSKWERGLRKQPSKDWTITEGLLYRGVEGSPSTGGRTFDGKDFVSADKAELKLDYRDAFSFAAWIKPRAEDGCILSRGEDYFEGQGHYLHLLKGKLRLHVVYRATDLGMRIETEEPIRMNEWQHVVVAFDGGIPASGVHMYVNGIERKLKILFDQNLWPMDTKEPLRIGAGGGLRFSGSIADARVYARALSASEAAVLGESTPLTDLASLQAAQRTTTQRDKLRMAFLATETPARVQRTRAELASLEKERRQLLDTVPTAMVMAESHPRQAHVLIRGAYDNPGDKVDAQTPTFLPAMAPELPRNRLGLAKWLVDRSNPLAARVAVNRMWQMLFGIGIVKTVEDFGSQGDWPSNPELLDWLAVEFMDSGWDIRHMLRLMVTSATYRQSSEVSPEMLQRDPENRLLARGSRFRLSAEMIRDSALAASGLLVDKPFGPPVKPYQPPGLWNELQGGTEYQNDHGEGLWRRSVYSYWRRTIAPPMMVNFDSPNRETCAVRQSRTNTPLQALNLMNDVTFLEAARKLAERMISEGGATRESRIVRGVRLILARDPKPLEEKTLLDLQRRFERFYAERPQDAERYLKQGEAPRDEKLPVVELASWTGVASLLLNLDETITRE